MHHQRATFGESLRDAIKQWGEKLVEQAGCLMDGARRSVDQGRRDVDRSRKSSGAGSLLSGGECALAAPALQSKHGTSPASSADEATTISVTPAASSASRTC
jgi:hypothetical protein